MSLPELKNDRLIRALLRQPTDTTPVWIMRQAGRYLPEYRATREQAGSFLDLCKNTELACEVTMQPLRRFDLDAAILFSDILTIPEAMGLGLYFAAGEGPKFERPLRSAADVARLGVPDPADSLRYVIDAVSLIRRELDGRVPLIGFSGSPWTLSTYMVEGGSSKEYQYIKGMMYGDPQTLHRLLDTLAKSVIAYLNAQIEAGCDGVISSGLEVPKLREFVDEKLLVVTPGIRPVDNKPAGDQKRVVTVETAFSNGADYIVVGRPIRDADSPRAAAESIQASIAEQFS